MSESDWNPDRYDSDHSYVYGYGEDVVDLLSPSDGERILDLGCGTGELTQEIERRGSGIEAVGVDSSDEMVTKARHEHPELDFLAADARSLSFDREFDAVFSNAALHWIPETDHGDVLSSVGRALRENGRFVAELGGKGNVSLVREAVRDELAERGYGYEEPWYFPRLGEYTALVEGNGFEVRHARLFDRPTVLEGECGMRSWLRMFGDGLLSEVPPEDEEEVISATEKRLKEDLYDAEENRWTADYRRLRFVAYKNCRKE